tara:strand:+ start:325 stop:525 length:201 start_codon:yes stop_codon:yes gene_type:complete
MARRYGRKAPVYKEPGGILEEGAATKEPVPSEPHRSWQGEAREKKRSAMARGLHPTKPSEMMALGC